MAPLDESPTPPAPPSSAPASGVTLNPNNSSPAEPKPAAPGTGPQPPGADSRAQILQTWEGRCEQRIQWLAFLIAIVTIFYAYYGLIAPLIAKAHLERLHAARYDLKELDYQFQALNRCYTMLVDGPGSSPIEGPRQLGRFRDLIIPKTEQYLIQNVTAGLESASTEKRLKLRSIAEAMGDLSDLLDDYQGWRSRWLITMPPEGSDVGRPEEPQLGIGTGKPASRTACSLRARHDIASREHVAQPRNTALTDDCPLQDLDRLIKLEMVISVLCGLEQNRDSISSQLAEDARTALASYPKLPVRIGDTLLNGLAYYPPMSEYTPTQKGRLKTAPHKGLESYKVIRLEADAPFEVTTTADLGQLADYVDAAIDRATDYQPTFLHIPAINISMDRFVVLTAVPILVLVLFHLLGFYIQRDYALIAHLTCTRSVPFEAYHHYSPNLLLYLASPPQPAPHNSTRWASRCATHIVRGINNVILGIACLTPLTVMVTCIYSGVMSPGPLPLTFRILLWAASGGCFLCMCAEIAWIWELHRSLRRTIS